MLSVTKRIEMVVQPRNGYVPKSLFSHKVYNDDMKVIDVDSHLTSIQGMAVDYLTRYCLCGDKEKAFEISILGAKEIDEVNGNNKELTRALSLLQGITGLNYQSIVNACKLVCYDVAYRTDIQLFRDPDTIEFSEDLYKNVEILVKRAYIFLCLKGPVIKDGFTFEGGYTLLVNSGDGDYLTEKMLIDLKTSKYSFFSTWSLQILVYYILGIHSEHREFQNIEQLCIFNPYLNESYICKLCDISDVVKYHVSRDVIGYKMAIPLDFYGDTLKAHEKAYSSWKKVDGSDVNILNKLLKKQLEKTDFSIDNYENGIFDISVDDYWTYLKTINPFQFRPKLSHTVSVKLIKKNGFYMFVSVSNKGKYSLLQGAKLRSLKKTLEYYYNNIERYAAYIIEQFSKYWDILKRISAKLQSIEPGKEYLKSAYKEYVSDHKSRFINNKMDYQEWYKEVRKYYRFSGRIHGCIIDLDCVNHIYVNPYDGTITPYYATSMYDKDVYVNIKALIADKRPEMLPAYTKMLAENDKNGDNLLLSKNNKSVIKLIAPSDERIREGFVKVYQYDMYKISSRLKALQEIYDSGRIVVWYDEVLQSNFTDMRSISTNVKIKDDKTDSTKRLPIKETKLVLEGQTIKQKNGLNATLIRYGGYKDVDFEFEDGTVITKQWLIRWQCGNLKHPVFKYGGTEKDNIINEKKKDTTFLKVNYLKDRGKEKYLGMTRKMKCGKNATVIEYNGCNDITIQFEDGSIKKGVRTDHFMNGYVSCRMKGDI